MKVIVDEMPKKPDCCLFASYDAEYDVCECILSYNGGYECKSVSSCPYLKVLEEK